MNRRLLAGAGAGAAAVALASAVYLWRAGGSSLAPPSAERATRGETRPPAAVGGPAAAPFVAQAAQPALEDLWHRLQAGDGTAEDLAGLRRRLLSGDAQQGIFEIRAFLATGRDASTGEAFTVTAGGALGGAPTLRVLLLDLLGQLAARTGGDEAARVGREILSEKTTADEWAVSLRNVGQYEPEATAYLGAKAREMLAYPPWRGAPSGGFLESFDVPVFAGDASFVSDFAELSRTGADTLQRAATVAMDRLSEANPLAVMGYLNSHPSEFADRPFLRADYFGKADLSDARQRSAVEFYLSRGDVDLEEKAKLIASLAAPASFISEALLTTPAVRPESPQRESAVPATLAAWRDDPRFTNLQPAIAETLGQLGK